MEPDLQSVVDNGDMLSEAVTVRTVTTLQDCILSLPGACTRSIRACFEECIARDKVTQELAESLWAEKVRPHGPAALPGFPNSLAWFLC